MLIFKNRNGLCNFQNSRGGDVESKEQSERKQERGKNTLKKSRRDSTKQNGKDNSIYQQLNHSKV